MPYIISVNMPGYLPEQDPTATATLDEARQHATDEVRRSPGYDEAMDLAPYTAADGAIAAMSTDGAVIGPLPDGYAIDVQRVTWTELATLAGYNTMTPRDDIAELERVGYQGQSFADEIIDAYNDHA